MTSSPLDLVVLVADADQKEVLETLLSRRGPALGVRGGVTFKVVKHTQRDPGCFNQGPAVVGPFVRQATHCLVILDHEGSGQERRPAMEIEADLRERLARSGWGERAAVVAIEPELESWVWSDSPEVDAALGWSGREPSLRAWLVERGLLASGRAKPNEPKRAVEEALRAHKLPRSAALYGRLAAKVSLERCEDASFLRLRQVLRAWFPAS